MNRPAAVFGQKANGLPRLQSLDSSTRSRGAEALHEVHAAKEELRRRAQEACAEVPAQPMRGSAPRCLDATPGTRKYEISWVLPEVQDTSVEVLHWMLFGLQTPRQIQSFRHPGFLRAIDAMGWKTIHPIPFVNKIHSMAED
eukprot:g16395.t1